MAANVNVMTAIKPPNLTPDQLTGLQVEVSARQNLLRQIIIGFERRYRCSLEELERKLENMEISEHPAWEDSIEWRNAVEQLVHLGINNPRPAPKSGLKVCHSSETSNLLSSRPEIRSFRRMIPTRRVQSRANLRRPKRVQGNFCRGVVGI